MNALNPFNYITMRTVLNLGGFSGDFRYKILKPMFVNFLMATNVFDIPAADADTGLDDSQTRERLHPFPEDWYLVTTRETLRR